MEEHATAQIVQAIDPSVKFTGVNILVKIHQLMSSNKYIQKDVDSKELKYKYVSSEAVMEKIQPSLIELGLVALPEFVTMAESNYTTAKGATWKYVRTRLTLIVADIATGEYCLAVGEGSGTDPGDKAVAKAQTMASKNLWCKLLNIPIGDDPEADPLTDQQQFYTYPHQTPQTVPTQPSAQQYTQQGYGFPYHESDIIGYYQLAGWDLNGLTGYIQRRFGRPPSQLTGEECYALVTEFHAYANQKGGLQPS